MRSINFLNVATPKQQQELKRWYRTSTVVIFLSFIILGTISTLQLYKLRNLRAHRQAHYKKAEPFTLHLERKKQLQEKISAIESKVDYVKKLAACTEQIGTVLSALDKICSDQIELASACLNNSSCKLVLCIPNLEIVNWCLKQIQEESGMKGLYITSLEPIDNKLKGSLLITLQQSAEHKAKA